MSEIKAGDVVELKSGGPLMTVQHVEVDIVYVAWFSEEYSNRDEFGAASLKLVKSAD